MKYYPAIFVLEPFHKEFLISLLIGKNVRIGHNCIIEDNVYIGDNSYICCN